MKRLLILSTLLLTACIIPQGSPDADRRDYTNDIQWPTLPMPTTCPNWQAGQTVNIAADITLPAGCYYERVKLVIQRPNVHVNFNGALFNGLSGQRQRNGFDAPYPAHNAPVQGCLQIVGFEGLPKVENIQISQAQFVNCAGSVVVNYQMSIETSQALKAGNYSNDTLRAAAPGNILLDNLTIINDHSDGLFLHRHVSDVTIQNSRINGSGSVGIYLGDEGQYNNILNSSFEGNGYSYYYSGSRVRQARLSEQTRREALAVDGSAFNRIEGNAFTDNGYHAINMYRNCYQNHTQPDEFPRTQGANDNVITGNTFLSGQDVWIASRQDRDMGKWDCGGQREPTAGSYWRDQAERNFVSANRFQNARVWVRGDWNTITDNQFNGGGVTVQSTIRTAVGEPLTGNQISNNTGAQ